MRWAASAGLPPASLAPASDGLWGSRKARKGVYCRVSGFRVSGFRVSGFRVSGFRVSGFRVSGFRGFRVLRS